MGQALLCTKHEFVSQKLAAQGLDKCTPSWVKKQLDDRAQEVVMNGDKSSWRKQD